MAWKYTHIYPVVLSLSLKSAALYKQRYKGWWVEWNTEEFDGSVETQDVASDSENKLENVLRWVYVVVGLNAESNVQL